MNENIQKKVERGSASVSMAASSYSWSEIDARAERLNNDRSTYIQGLIYLDMKYGLLDNYRYLEYLKSKGKQTLRFIDVVVILLLTSMFVLLLFIILLGA